jgi:hypothetical protein
MRYKYFTDTLTYQASVIFRTIGLIRMRIKMLSNIKHLAAMKQSHTIPTETQGHCENSSENHAAQTKRTRREKSAENKARFAAMQAEAQVEAHTLANTAPTLLEATLKNSAALMPAQACASTAGEIAVRGETAPALGRPSEYTQEEGDVICAWIANGKSLSSYCRMHGRAMDTVYRWLRTHALFREGYARAHEDRADTLADEMLEIADSPQAARSIEDAQAAKLRVETRKWIASKLRPQKWGEKQTVEHVGGVSIRIGIPQKQAAANVIDVSEKPKLS